MAKSKIVITFAAGVALNESLEFTYTNTTWKIPTLLLRKHTWVEVKYKAGQVQRVTIPGEPYSADDSAIAYVSAFQVDYNVPPQFNITRVNNIVTIEAIYDGVEFSAFLATASASAVITNVAYVAPVLFNTPTFTPATVNDVCNFAKVNVIATKTITSLSSPISMTPNASSFNFEYLRGTTFTLTGTDGTDTANRTVTMPSVLENPVVSITNKPNGANIVLSVTNIDLTLTYSLNGVDYQSSSLFTTVLPGTYQGYVKDQFGCVKTTPFSIDIFTPTVAVLKPIFYLSNANSIRFKDLVVWDHKTIHQTDENTLSCEEAKNDMNVINYRYTQKFQSNDVINTQFTTSYATVSAKVISDGVETAVEVEKLTNFIGLKDRRDCRIYEREDGTTGIYFLSGLIYDYDSLLATGSYTTNSPLPDWAKVNRSIYADELGDYITIENILFDTTLQRDVLVCNAGYVGVEKATVVQTIYNLFGFDVYNITTAMGVYEDKDLQIQIDVADPNFTNRTKLSERINVKEWQKNTIEVQSLNTEDNDIFYSLGISHLLRLSYLSFSPLPELEREISKADQSIVAVSTDLFAKRQIIFDRLSTMMADKVAEIFGQDTIAINGALFTTESIEIAKQGSTNLHNVTVTLYKTKEQQESTFNDTGLIFPGSFIAPTLLVHEDGGFIIVDPLDEEGLVSVL